MFLHEDTTVFIDTINRIHSTIGLDESIIEKDYYVFIMLKLIVQKLTHDGKQDVVFKGGTSLSKAYNVIQRFSEDIDLCLPQDKIKTDGARKRLTNAITSSMKELGLEDCSIRKIERTGVYNDIRGKYESICKDNIVEHYIKIETAHRIKEYPVTFMLINSYITTYIREHLGSDAISEYKLEPFYVQTVSMYRTFIDKLFALADYYLEHKVTRYSRHLYDLHKIIGSIDWSNEITVHSIKELVTQVRIERQSSSKCLSAQPGNDLKEIINRALIEDFYLEDYKELTQRILFEQVDYNTCKQTILNFIQLDII